MPTKELFSTQKDRLAIKKVQLQRLPASVFNFSFVSQEEMQL